MFNEFYCKNFIYYLLVTFFVVQSGFNTEVKKDCYPITFFNFSN